MSPPVVSIIGPFASPARLLLARKTINLLLRQSYVPYEIVVVNGTGDRLTTNDELSSPKAAEAGNCLREVQAQVGLPPSAMRNVGIRAASGDWIVCADDDDYFHPHRLLQQMAHRRGTLPCLLRYQLRIDISRIVKPDESTVEGQPIKPWLHLLRKESGIPSTMLFPRLDPATKSPWLFDESLQEGEFEELLSRMPGQRVVFDNAHTRFSADTQPSLLSIALYHGENMLSYRKFFGDVDRTSAETEVPIGLNSSDIEYLKKVFAIYDFKVF